MACLALITGRISLQTTETVKRRVSLESNIGKRMKEITEPLKGNAHITIERGGFFFLYTAILLD